jgi:hypothetical protein
MADITKNTGEISSVSLGDTINDWRNLTNDQVIAKLNLLKVYDISAGIGLDVTGGFAAGGVGGTYEMQISNTIDKNITIDGDLNVTGNVSFSTSGEVTFPNGLVNVNGDDTPVAGAATAGIVVGSYTGPDFNSGTTAPYFLNVGGSWFTNQDLKLIGGGILANSANQRILFGETNGKTLSFSQTADDLVIGNDHLQDIVPVGTTLAGQIARIRSSDGRVDILKGVNKRRVSGISHGFSFGRVVRASHDDPTGFTLAYSSGATHAEAVGMISRVNGDSDFEVTFNGEVEGNFTSAINIGGSLSVGCSYFLHTANGQISTTEPNAVGHVSKPVLIGLASDRGLFVNYRGQSIYSGGGAGSGVSGGDGTSIRTTISSGSFALGDIICLTENGTYEKLSVNNYTRVFGLIVNTVGSGYEVLLYGLSKTTDSFRVQTHVDEWGTSTDPYLFMNRATGTLSTVTDTGSTDISPGGLAISNEIVFYLNTRYGTLYTTPEQVTLNSTSRSSAAYTAAIVAGGGSGPTPGSGGYVPSSPSSNSVNNILVNGGFDVWQRGIGVSSLYTTTGDTFFADRWARTSKLSGSSGASADMSIERKSFVGGQYAVMGSPRYYTEVMASIIGGSGETAGDYVSFDNRIEDANSYANTPVALSFYARGTSGATGFLAVEYRQYWDGTYANSTSQNLDLIYLDGTTDWSRYAIAFVPSKLPSGVSYNQDESFSSVGIFPYRFNGVTGNTGAADVSYSQPFSIAKVQLEPGVTITNPKRIEINDELNRCKRYYQTSYEYGDYIGKTTLSGSLPNTSSPEVIMSIGGNIKYSLPIAMRKVPDTISIWSPSGVPSMAFNVSAGLDLNKTSGTKGFNNATRVGLSSSSVSASSTSSDGINIFFPSGVVPVDRVSFHISADAEYNEGVNN